MADYDFRAGDTGSKLRVTCKDSVTGVAIPLTGATVNLQWRKADGTLASVTMTVTDAPNGVAEYQFLTGELFAPGMDFSVKVIDSGGKELKNINTVHKTVRAAP